MKRSILKLLTYLTTCIIILSHSVFAQEFTKNISKEYSVDASSYFQVTNKFGEIKIENWESDKLSIVVTLKVEAKDQAKADKFFEKININFAEADTLISAVTEFKSDLNESKFSIDYKIMMPKYLRLGLTNSYGDVYIQELTGKSLINVEYGNLKADKLIFGESKPRSVLMLSYSEASIQECDWLKLMLSFSDIEIQKSEALIIKSKYSEINVVEANSIVTESKYDDPFEIGKLENFVCTGEYSDYKIGSLSGTLNVDLKYSELNIEEVAKDFTKLDIIVNYGNADVEINSGASYKLSAESEYSEIELPDNNDISESSDKSDAKIDGIIGTNKNTKSTVTINAKFSNVDLD